MAEGYGILDFESIWNLARDLVYGVFMQGMLLDDEGNLVGCTDTIEDWLEKRNTDLRFKYLNFRECEELQELSLAEASELYTADIKEKYLFEAVPFIRTVMRKGSLTPYQFVKDEVPDEYLDEIICTAWKADLQIWASSWDYKRKNSELKKEDK